MSEEYLNLLFDDTRVANGIVIDRIFWASALLLLPFVFFFFICVCYSTVIYLSLYVTILIVNFIKMYTLYSEFHQSDLSTISLEKKNGNKKLKVFRAYSVFNYCTVYTKSKTRDYVRRFKC